MPCTADDFKGRFTIAHHVCTAHTVPVLQMPLLDSLCGPLTRSRGPISDQHMNTGPLGLHRARPVELRSPLVRTSGPQGSAEYCWNVACVLSSFSQCWWFSWQFCFSVSHSWDRCDCSQKSRFFSTAFFPNILWEVMILRFLIWKYRVYHILTL